jgi:hypothetical protein
MALHFPDAEFRNTGLERVAGLNKDLDWLKSQGHEIPEPGSPASAIQHTSESWRRKIHLLLYATSTTSILHIQLAAG